MPKKEPTKIDRDDLIDAITDGRVIQALIKSLLVELRPAIDDIVRAHVEQLEAALNEKIEDSVNKEVEKQTKELRESVVELKRESESLKERLEQLESYSKADNLVFHGIPEMDYSEKASEGMVGDGNTKDYTSTLCDLVMDICNERLGVTIGKQDISIAHRLRRGKKETTRPVIVRFTTRRVRDEVYRARRSLRLPAGSKDLSKPAIYINEQLTRANDEIYFQARKLLRNKVIARTWTNGGEVFIKKTMSMDEKPTMVRSIKDLPGEM